METLRCVQSETLVPLDRFTNNLPIRIDLAYAHDKNLLFGERIYRPDARLWLHEDLARIVCKAAEFIHKKRLRLVLYDGLRTVEAQKRMLETTRVQNNPHWLKEPRLLSPPGAGAHPRGMAIDCALETLDNTLLDMGTPFDFLAEHPDQKHNPAHRDYKGLSPNILQNRTILDTAMKEAAVFFNTDLFLLPQEWWDFRLKPEIYEQYAPLHDSDLPPVMRMTSPFDA